MADPNYTKHASAAILLFLFIFIYQLPFIPAVAADSPPLYIPTDNIVLDCGSNSNSSSVDLDTRTWVGDVTSKFFPSDTQQNNASVTLLAEPRFLSVFNAPYVTARLSRSPFTYFFPLTPGQKFIRLSFYSASYRGFDRSKAVFSVRAGLYTLLRDFNASLNADDSGKIFREFCLYVEGNDQKLNITFIPTNRDSYAFISGIEIVSMPTNLYYTPPELGDQGGRGLRIVGTASGFLPIENYASLENVYRVNIGGNDISIGDDTGMFRAWSSELNFLDPGILYEAQPFNGTINLNFSKISNYTAPKNVYETARTMGPDRTINHRYNLTWKYPVDPGFSYMLRLHFCEFEAEINSPGERVFLIHIGGNIAEQAADVIRWAGGKGIPYRRDYAVLLPYPSSGEKKKVNLTLTLQANPVDSNTAWANVILNGIEIFKLNDSSGNLGGQNPDPTSTTTTQSFPPLSISKSKNSKGRTVTIVIAAVVGGVVALLALGFFVFRRHRTLKDQYSTDGTSWWAPYSISTNKSSKTRSSTLPSDLCRYFSLAEIRAATKDFDDAFIIGVGGFGNVYKGYIDDGSTQVAIKRLKPGSKQGVHEFKTEIEVLSQLRHRHLVSLIGYCNDGNEMILVYEYMTHGTLRDHLYGGDEGESLTWYQRLQICIGAARGLHYLHTGAKHTIIHRDVKTTNILLDEKWVAKVSDFGLSKVGSMNVSKAHVSTVVKGSFGYLDPEYIRRWQLTEKSDVYSFGVVLCEVLFARPPLIRTAEENQVTLAEWVRRCANYNTVAQVVDPKIKNEIAPECLRKFIKIAVSCIQGDGIKRPSMNEVVWGLEFASKLQENSKKRGDKLSGPDSEEGADEESWLMDETLLSHSHPMTTSSSDTSSSAYKGISGTVFSEIMDLKGR